MGKIVKSFFSSPKPKAPAFTPPSAPEPDPEPVENLEDDKAKNKKARVALTETAGGAAGEELNPDEVSKKRRTLLGN